MGGTNLDGIDYAKIFAGISGLKGLNTDRHRNLS
jgi:hypothetical protein